MCAPVGGSGTMVAEEKKYTYLGVDKERLGGGGRAGRGRRMICVVGKGKFRKQSRGRIIWCHD